MNIGRISNCTFKGAYFISGNGRDVKKAEDNIKAENQNAKTYAIGAEYTTDTLPAYILVTTGKDTETYDSFRRNKENEYRSEAEDNKPAKFEKRDFRNVKAYASYSIYYKAGIHMDVINKYCKFEQSPKILDANEVLDSITHKKFDFENGKIEE